MINLEFISYWVRKLESGEYQQGRSCLREIRDDETYVYCCLGVACDIYDNTKWNSLNSYCLDDSIGDDAVLPTSLMNHIGIDSNTQSELIEMNDGKRLTFKQIAAYLREKYLKVDNVNV